MNLLEGGLAAVPKPMDEFTSKRSSLSLTVSIELRFLKHLRCLDAVTIQKIRMGMYVTLSYVDRQFGTADL
jgi:hypothetical protein